MTDSGRSDIDGSGDLREVQWRAFLAGYDQRNRESASGLSGHPAMLPLEREFERWLEHEQAPR